MIQDNTYEKTIKIIVATHKSYQMPEDSVYLPLLVGAEQNRIAWNRARDDEGHNISCKNPCYCELTGLYWAWKNVNSEYIGLVHYRRYFSNGRWWMRRKDRILSGPEIASVLQTADILLPRPRHYWIETNFSQYVHAHHQQDLDFTRQIIRDRYPQYLRAFDRTMKKRSGHRFNMLIMKKELLDRYCSWLFDILAGLEKVLDISAYSKNDRRVFGFVGERLLDVWIDTNHYAYKNISYVFLEKQNWFLKGMRFIWRKIKSD